MNGRRNQLGHLIKDFTLSHNVIVYILLFSVFDNFIKSMLVNTVGKMINQYKCILVDRTFLSKLSKIELQNIFYCVKQNKLSGCTLNLHTKIFNQNEFRYKFTDSLGVCT